MKRCTSYENANLSMSIGNIATIPSVANSNDYTFLNIQNNSNVSVTLSKIIISYNGKQITGSDINTYVDTSNCTAIDAKNACQIIIFANVIDNGYMLELTFKDNYGDVVNLTKLISFSNSLPAIDGFIYATDNIAVSSMESNIISVPFRLDHDYTDIQLSISGVSTNFACPNGFAKNSLCTAFINNAVAKSANSNSIMNTIADDGSHQYSLSMNILVFTSSNEANLIASGINVIVNPSTGAAPNAKQVFIYNNGIGVASQINITAATTIVISSNTCGTTLAANTSCSFYVNATSAVSGQSGVVVTYNSGVQAKVFNFNVVYISSVPSPLLVLTPSGSFTNVVNNGSPKTLYVSITNSGSNNLSTLSFSNINLQVATMASSTSGTSCLLGQSLAIGSSCIVALSFSPIAVISGSINFIANSNYFNQAGIIQSYANSTLALSYSSVAGAVFRAVGDFGMVITSPAGGTGTWTANIDSPFTTTGQSVTGMTKNGSTYVIARSDGAVKYSTVNGLIWQSATTTNMSTNNTGCMGFNGV